MASEGRLAEKRTERLKGINEIATSDATQAMEVFLIFRDDGVGA
jgi:hypothetical protein